MSYWIIDVGFTTHEGIKLMAFWLQFPWLIMVDYGRSPFSGAKSVDQIDSAYQKQLHELLLSLIFPIAAKLQYTDAYASTNSSKIPQAIPIC